MRGGAASILEDAIGVGSVVLTLYEKAKRTAEAVAKPA